MSIYSRSKAKSFLVLSSSKNKGFTLIELVVGIVLLAICYALINNFMFPAVKHHADQMHQIRAAELGQSMLNEILNRAYDHQSDHEGGVLRCGDSANGAADCTAPASLGIETLAGETADNRENWNDVDDYHGATIAGNTIDDSYLGYEIAIDVCYDMNYDGVCETDGSANRNVAKRIEVDVKTPLDVVISFVSYRSNF